MPPTGGQRPRSEPDLAGSGVRHGQTPRNPPPSAARQHTGRAMAPINKGPWPDPGRAGPGPAVSGVVLSIRLLTKAPAE